MDKFENFQLAVTTRAEALALARQTLSANQMVSSFRSDQIHVSLIPEYILGELFYLLAKRFAVINYSYCAVSWIRCGMEELVHAFEIDSTCPNFLSRENKEQLNSANRLLEMAFYDVELESGSHNFAVEFLKDIFKHKDFIKRHLLHNPESMYDDIIALARSLPFKRPDDDPDYLSMDDMQQLSKQIEEGSSEGPTL